MLTASIREAHKLSDGTYGMPRVRAELQEAGHRVSRKKVATLMRRAHIRGVSRRRGFVVTTERDVRQRHEQTEEVPRYNRLEHLSALEN